MLSNIVQTHLDFIVFMFALLCERFIPLSRLYHPGTFMHGIYSAIGKRIYKKSEPKSYLYLAATLGAMLPSILIVIICALVLEFAFYPELLHGCILYFCLEKQTTINKIKRITLLCKKNQKSAARELLKPLLAREVKNLSAPGIYKALIETLILRSARFYFSVITIYLILGPFAALFYRLLTIAQQAWRDDIAPNSHFLKPVQLILFVFELIPTRLLALTIASSKATKNSIHYIKHYGRHFYQTNTGWLLSCCSAVLGAQLGGPAIYFNQRYNKMRVGTQRLPQAQDILIVINTLNQAFILWLLVITAIKISFAII
ncbi:cobalamin biosynthesis protein [Pseudoalteromonas sp. MMG010]|uniref:cobalamin biosynthesis protein CobD/CbiB n=1 Tax=Pseudoalteromonas sp. MMG010 TaxID=2822685 RepID=UPI001B3A2DEA|nr:cobalamin biosynthesis protein [Pseudoalteromonas sp. MMG010]MBQ4834676.1 cobalamin biosynthesis protein [Pseudoalteromonas sp. MMG010]